MGLFDRGVGLMFRRVEVGEERATLRDVRVINDKVRLLAKLGTALIAAKSEGAHLDAAVDAAVGGERLANRRWPKSLPTAFLRPAWRKVVLGTKASGTPAHRRTWEAATLLELRDCLRAGDIWVEGSRQWRAVEDQLISPALFAAMREAGPLPITGPMTAEVYLAERRALLERRLAEVEAKAASERLEDVRIKRAKLIVRPLKAITPEAAENLAARLYAMLPSTRITGVLVEVSRWTGLAQAFTHCTRACRPTICAWSSPPSSPTPPTSAWTAWPRPARWPATASSPGLLAGTCARTHTVPRPLS